MLILIWGFFAKVKLACANVAHIGFSVLLYCFSPFIVTI